MTNATAIQVGDVVQIDPEHDARFAACFLVVTEVKSWGVQGYVRVPGENGGDAYYRVPYERIHRIGAAEWLHEQHAVDGGRIASSEAVEPSKPTAS